jgi:hypothetical protein
MAFSKSVLTAGLLLACFSSYALADTGSADWVGGYTLTTSTDSYDFTHTPDKVCLYFGSSSYCAGNQLTYGPVSVNTGMSQAEFEQALRDATAGQ